MELHDMRGSPQTPQPHHQTPDTQTVSEQISTRSTPASVGEGREQIINLPDGDQAANTPTKIQEPLAPTIRHHNQPSPLHARTISLPVTSPAERERLRTQQQQPPRPLYHSQSERGPRRPELERSMSRKDMIKNYIKKEAATFFGVEEETEIEQQHLWLDRRKRMMTRAYGALKEEYRAPTLRDHRRTVSEIPISRSAMSGQLIAERPDVLPGPSDDIPDTHAPSSGVSLKRKESVARMTWDGLSYVVTTLARQKSRPRTQQQPVSRSFPPDVPLSTDSISVEETSFFDDTVNVASPRLPEAGDTVDRLEQEPQVTYRHPRFQRTGYGGWRRAHRGEALNAPPTSRVGGNRIFSNCLDNLLDNSDRRQYGMGWVGRMFGRSLRKSVAQSEIVQDQLDDIEDHRPFFTYWVTTVQVLVFVISIICYGFGSFGFDLQSKTGQVLVTSLSLQQVEYTEPANFWLGPRAADLIHLGAKFAPCMRTDDKIQKEVGKVRTKEKDTACCIRNDDSGCVQASKQDCSELISTWKKWTEKNAGPDGRVSGTVCGLDPKFCDAPASVHPYEWPDDITKWPICKKTNSLSSRKGPRYNQDEHMICEIIGHPCCIGIHGYCKIATKEYCDFVKGTFHEEASLCSQVACLNDVCGMIPFYFPDTPDQFYRLWTSLFLHAGFLQLGITVLFQYFLMRDLEKLTGSLRICIIYMGSGVAGNLASAIFIPYRADVGPSGSQFGLLACLIVEVLNAWPMLAEPNRALLKLISVNAFLFLIGLLPWVDNYAHLFGFIFGFLLSYALLPFISFGPYDRQKKIALIWVCLLSSGILFLVLVILFYVIPVYDSHVWSYFDCIPLTRDFCASQNINFKREQAVLL